MNQNNFYISRPQFTIDPRYLDVKRLDLGDGVNMFNPDKPIVSTKQAFEPPQKMFRATGFQKLPSTIFDYFNLRESMSISEEANVLSQNFKASYGLSSLDQAYKRSREEKETSHSIYYLGEHSGETDTFPSSNLVWQSVPTAESLEDEEEIMMQFLEDYGSHYVSSITYGLRIAVRGKLNSKDTTRVTDFSAAMKVAFGLFSAKGSISKEDRKKLTSTDIDLLLEITSGGISPSRIITSTSIDDISDFLKNVKEGNIEFALAPISATVKSYWSTLNLEYKKSRKLLNPNQPFATPPALYGVPKGTIVSWYPSPEYVKGLEDTTQESIIEPPLGWAICNGKNGTPDLSNQFIRGTDMFSMVGSKGGNLTHDHGGTTQKNTDTRGAHGGTGGKYNQPAEKHNHKIDDSEHLPPYTLLVYIMKMDDKS